MKGSNFLKYCCVGVRVITLRVRTLSPCNMISDMLVLLFCLGYWSFFFSKLVFLHMLHYTSVFVQEDIISCHGIQHNNTWFAFCVLKAAGAPDSSMYSQWTIMKVAASCYPLCCSMKWACARLCLPQASQCVIWSLSVCISLLNLISKRRFIYS